MKPYPYQEKAINEILHKFTENQKILLQAHTGFGKTVVFTFITKHWIETFKEKVIILCHRKELVDQTIKTLRGVGLSCQSILPGTKQVHHFVDVYVCMVETLNKRLENKKMDFPSIGLIIEDECHVLVFEKIHKFFEESKVLGVTATPVVLKKVKFFKCKYRHAEYESELECHGEVTEEWRKPFSMSQIYNDIVIGEDINHLIEFGQLVHEVTFAKNYADMDSLKVDADGEFTSKSMDASYGNDNAAFNVLLNYKELALGKRTIIFNSSAKVNKLIYDKFKEDGLNVRMFDSVNREDSGSRVKLIEWFRNTPDAILCNVNVFTAGFDCKEVEAIIINRPTLSLALYLQMVGRGGRASQLIYKDHFIFIDGGGNRDRFGDWSDPNRDWENIFYNGLGKPKAKKIDAFDIQDCENCGALFPKSENTCPECGEEIVPSKPRETKIKAESEDIMVPIRKIPPPNAKQIHEYTVRRGENINFAYKILYSRIKDMFVYYRVTKDTYNKTKNNGKLEGKIRKMVYPVYFHLMKQDDIQTGAHRTLEYVVEKSKETLEKHYYGN